MKASRITSLSTICYSLLAGTFFVVFLQAGRVSFAVHMALEISRDPYPSGGVRLGTPIPTRARIHERPARLKISRTGFIFENIIETSKRENFIVNSAILAEPAVVNLRVTFLIKYIERFK